MIADGRLLLAPHHTLPMLILGVDTSTLGGSLAVLRDGVVLGELSTRVEETYSSRMFRHLAFLLRELSLDLSMFDMFAVAAGPGSFTGLRVGLTAVKGWAEAYGKPIAAVSTLEAVARQAHAAEPRLVPVMDARRGQIYGGIYTREASELRQTGDQVVMTPAEFLAYLSSQVGTDRLTFVSPTPEVLSQPLARSAFRGAAVELVSTVLAPIIGQIGLTRAQRGELVDPLTLDANYIRRSDAELLWRGP